MIMSVVNVNAQDTAINVDNGQFTLSEAIVRNNFDYKAVLQRIKEDNEPESTHEEAIVILLGLIHAVESAAIEQQKTIEKDLNAEEVVMV